MKCYRFLLFLLFSSVSFFFVFLHVDKKFSFISMKNCPLTHQEMKNVQGMFFNFSSQRRSWIKRVASGVMIHLVGSLIDTLSHQAKLYLQKEKMQREKEILQDEKRELETELIEMRKMVREKNHLNKKTFLLRDL